MARSRRARIASLIARATFASLFALALSVLIVSSRSQPSLLDHAKRVFQAPSGFYIERNYQWIGPRELIAVVTDLNNINSDRQVARLRTDTGQISVLQHNNAKTTNLGNYRFSPDGRWYLCSTNKNDNNSFYLCASDDSSCVRVYTEHSDGVASEPFTWLGDSKHWICMPDSTYDPVQIRDGTSPGGKKVSLPEPTEGSSVELSADSRHVPIRVWLGNETRASVPVTLYNPETPKASTRMSIPMPVSGQVKEMVVSPSGENLAWVIFVRNPTPFLDKVLKRIPFLRKQNSNDTYQLWTTRFDGSHPKLLGVKDIRVYWDKGTGCTGPGWMHEGSFYNSEWTYDEQGVSFTLDRSMYVVDNK